MILSVASGKGGTGKTTVAVNLALALAGERRGVTLLDADVEEPNAHIFLRPDWDGHEAVTIPVPVVNEEDCVHCGRCADVCAFSAITVIREAVLVFPELCHGCGGCSLLCPEKAITESPRPVGSVEWGRASGCPALTLVQGSLNPGEALAPPVTRAARKKAAGLCGAELTIIDAPPGTSCPAVEAIKGSDFCLLVTEPTPFGLNDLALAVELTRKLGIPTGVVINRAGLGDDRVDRYCEDEKLPVLARLPYDRGLAEAYSRGETAGRVVSGWLERFVELGERVIGPADSRAPERSES